MQKTILFLHITSLFKAKDGDAENENRLTGQQAFREPSSPSTSFPSAALPKGRSTGLEPSLLPVATPGGSQCDPCRMGAGEKRIPLSHRVLGGHSPLLCWQDCDGTMGALRCGSSAQHFREKKHFCNQNKVLRLFSSFF